MKKGVKSFIVITICAMLLTMTRVVFAAQFVRIGSGTVGGGFYTAGTAIVSVINSLQKEVNYSAVTGGSIKNLIDLGKKDIEFGMSLTSTLDEAWNGVTNFPEKLQTLRYVATIYPQVSHIIVGKGINSVADLRGKRVDFGPIGGGIDTNNRLTLEAYGIPESEVRIQRNARTETAEGFEAGTTDAQILLTAYPSSQVNDMIARGARLISVEPEMRDKICKDYPFYVPWDIPGGTYDGYPDDLIGFSAFCAMLTYDDMDDETVYNFVKTLFEGTEGLKQRSAGVFGYFALEHALEGCNIPIHPGAERYYKEVGLLK
jgi:TRAP transporter TAXI family solute receptor